MSRLAPAPHAFGGSARALQPHTLLLLLTAALTLPVALFGLGQLGSKVLRQLSGSPEMIDYLSFFTAARLLADDPRHLYDLHTWAAVRSQLNVTEMPLMQFWSPPHTALLLAPLAWLPFGVSYATRSPWRSTLPVSLPPATC